MHKLFTFYKAPVHAEAARLFSNIYTFLKVDNVIAFLIYCYHLEFMIDNNKLKKCTGQILNHNTSRFKTK